jgi:hypothetical protein
LALVQRAVLLNAAREEERGEAVKTAAPLKLLARAGAAAWPKKDARSGAACFDTKSTSNRCELHQSASIKQLYYSKKILAWILIFSDAHTLVSESA